MNGNRLFVLFFLWEDGTHCDGATVTRRLKRCVRRILAFGPLRQVRDGPDFLGRQTVK